MEHILEEINPFITEDFFLEEQLEMDNMAASFGTFSLASSGSCPASTVASLSSASSCG
ncbi:thiocillin family RiPP [Streptococcus sp. 596553]|uniref:thiocillin family RiPP n=1 Tax=Streptococcus sp. 596553 TaxID=2250596 RepID=UPI000DD84AA2|nr:thiocillin family RiPP [Streptococcus sp. 596553]